MPAAEGLVAVVREWVAMAENDLSNAANTLKMGAGCPTDTVCYHAQQCAEKYLKALLCLRGIAFPKTHDLGILVGLVPDAARLDLTGEELDVLTDYAISARYPGFGSITLTEARRAVRLCRRVRRAARGQMPRAVLRA